MINYLLLFLNIISFILFFADKYFAKKHMHRISEKTLLVSAFFGGAIGAYFGMYINRHKTKKLKFVILVPLFLLLQLAAYFFFYLK